MNKKNKFFIIGLIFLVLFMISAVSASENLTSGNLTMGINDDASLEKISDVNDSSSVLTESESEIVGASVNKSDVLYIPENLDVLSSDPIVPAIGNSYISADEIWAEAEKTSVFDRTFKIGYYQVTLSKSEYYYLKLSPLLDSFAKEGDYPEYFGLKKYYHVDYDDSLSCNIIKKTGNFIIIKYGLGNPKFLSKNIKVFKTLKQAKIYANNLNKKFYKISRYYDVKKSGKKFFVTVNLIKFKKYKTMKLPVYMGFTYGYGAKYMNSNYKYSVGLFFQYVNGFRIVYKSKNVQFVKWGNNLSTLNKYSTHRY